MSKPQKAFRRGYRFKSFRGAPAPTCSVVGSERLIVPLLQGTGEPAEPTVETGASIERGQVIATADGRVGSPVHASASGTVDSIGKTSITITVTTSDEKTRLLNGATAEWENLKPQAIRKLLYDSGVAGIDSDGIPTEHLSSMIGPADVERVIVKLIPDDVLDVDPACMLEGDRFEHFATGLRILAAAFPDASVTVAVSKSLGPLAARIAEATGSGRVEVAMVSARYPQSSDPVLVTTITGDAFPYGYRPINLGIVCLDYQTAIHVTEAVTEGLPVTTRRIALAGSSIAEPTHIDVAIGTPVASITEGRTTGDSVRTIMDSIMTGNVASDEEVVVRSTRGIYCIPEARQIETFAFASPGFAKDSFTNTFLAKLLPVKKESNTNLHGERRACLNCSFCSDVCPVEIMPNILHRYVERDLVSETLPRLGILKCIDCNLCTYVCPSKIPLAALMKEGKERLFKEGFVTEEDMRRDFTLKGLDR